MKSRMRTHKKRTKEQTQEFSSAPAQGMFQSRPFVVQTQQAEKSQQPDLNTSLMRAERYGHHLGRKKKTENPENKPVQLVSNKKKTDKKKTDQGQPSQPQEQKAELEKLLEIKKEDLEEALKIGDFSKEEIRVSLDEDFQGDKQEWIDYWVPWINGNAQKSRGQSEAGIGGKSDWMTGAMSSEVARKLDSRKGKEFAEGAGHTMHHKISRATISVLVQKYNQLPDKGIASEFQKFVNEIGKKVNATSMEKILINMPANLELGPSSDKRVGDPGSGFDPNIEKQSGRMTPRSTQLDEASRVMEGKMTTAEEWNKLTQFLRQADEQHKEEFSGDLVSNPRPNLWTQEKGGKYRKNG